MESRKLLESTENNFLVQVLDRTARNKVLMDQLLTSAEDIIKELENGSSRGCHDYSLTEFVMLSNMGLANSRLRTLKFPCFLQERH